jgi:tetratricopeptide (TPR) repeat protein
LDWARTQVGLGIALRSLGEREADTERLEQAVDAYQQALKELTRERVPLDWATTQLGLGNALASLGERKKERAYFNQAKTAFQSAHAVWKEAGYSQYDGYFEETLRRLDQRMAQY